MRVLITGASGFIGTSVQRHLEGECEFTRYIRGTSPEIDHDVVLHLAGKAHDTDEASDPGSYYRSNTDLTKSLFDAFLASQARVFIFMSSVKAVAEHAREPLTEDTVPNPATHYGKSKLQAEQHLILKMGTSGKKIFILRPCLVYGPCQKGNLSLLSTVIRRGLPWPFGAFDNVRSFCAVENLSTTIKALIFRDDIAEGVYHIADDDPISTRELVSVIGTALGKPARVLVIPEQVIRVGAALGDMLHLPFNTSRLSRLTESYVVSNQKIRKAIGTPFPVTTREGLIQAFQHAHIHSDS